MNAEIINSRTEKLRALMADKKLDAFILIVDERANSESCHYISGFRGSSAGLIISMNESIIITDGRYQTQVKEQSPFKAVIQSELSVPAYIAKAINESEY
ncbi:MAG: aminopeptidase P family N-terminal domain-containing protein, partial [Synergistaceae bacterium]|nr:aminopeptidase P family N-terminal domain-containing protein [Synergistaceae bacterium]